ncbi:MAG: HEAT repeat domain-containing protein [Gemmatimonadaceae bacterium]
MSLTSILAWTLLHFVWQGTLIAVGLALVLAATRRRSAGLRYQASVAAMFLMVALPVVTAVQLSGRAPAGNAIENAGTPNDFRTASGGTARGAERTVSNRSVDRNASTLSPLGAEDRLVTSGLSQRMQTLGDRAAPALVIAWLLGVLLLSLRFGGGWLRVRQLTRSHVHAASAEATARLQELARRLGVTRPVQLLESAVVQVPTVIGWLRPVLLMPLALECGLTPRDLELLFAHELAHIRRQDYLVNLLQTVVETLLFYHPGVWWVSNQVREEREHCCDDIAVALCDDRRVYAEALLRLEELRQAEPQLALAATGGNLLKRVRRLLTSPANRGDSRVRWAALPLGAAALVGIAGGPTLHRLSMTNDSYIDNAEHWTATGDTVQYAGRNARPDTVIRVDEGSLSLAERWSRAERAGKARGGTGFWIGFVINGDASRGWTYVDRRVPVYSRGNTMMGSIHFKGAPQGLTFLGQRLDSLVGNQYAPDDQVVLYGFTHKSGSWELDRIHASAFAFPAYFSGRTLYWAGRAGDEESIAIAQRLFEETRDQDDRGDLVAVVGMHINDEPVLKTFRRWLQTTESHSTRSAVADHLGELSIPGAVSLAAEVARKDPSRDVRREAAESLGEISLAPALDTLISLTRTVDDREVRRAAVEALGERSEPRAFEALVRLAWNDPDREVAEQAIETIANRHRDNAVSELTRLAREHSREEMRSKALEALGELEEPDTVLPILKSVVEKDPSAEVRKNAVDAIAELKTSASAAVLKDIARNHSDPELRRKAIEVLADQDDKSAAFELLSGLLTSPASEKDQQAAIEQLADLEDGRVLATLERVASTNPSLRVRKSAVEAMAGTKDHRAAIEAVDKVVWRDGDVELQKAALDALDSFEDEGQVARLSKVSQDHPRLEVRKAAIEKLGGMERNAAAMQQLDRLARGNGDGEIRASALEAYVSAARPADAVVLLRAVVSGTGDSELPGKALDMLDGFDKGEGIPVIIEVARSHPNRDLRRRAIEMLGDSDDPRAHAELSRLLEKK